jgi:hypothetical protein
MLERRDHQTSMNEPLAFLRAFTEAEHRASHTSNAEADDRQPPHPAMDDSDMVSGDLRARLNRRRGGLVSQPTGMDCVAITIPQQRCSIFAIARYRHGGTDVYRAWVGGIEPGRRGEGMRENLYVSRENSRLKVVARYAVCSDCLGAGTHRSGVACAACDGAGWFHRGGRRWLALGRMLELRKLGPPSDQRYRRGYDAIG